MIDLIILNHHNLMMFVFSLLLTQPKNNQSNISVEIIISLSWQLLVMNNFSWWSESICSQPEPEIDNNNNITHIMVMLMMITMKKLDGSVILLVYKQYYCALCKFFHQQLYHNDNDDHVDDPMNFYLTLISISLSIIFINFDSS